MSVRRYSVVLSVKDRGFITGVNGSIEPLCLSPYRMVFYV